MEKDNKYEKLSAYVDGELSPGEMDKFEEEIALSQDLQKKLDELKKLKQLTTTSSKKLPESPYFETRLFASLAGHSSSAFRLKRLSPFVGFAILTVSLMIFLKFNPQVIDRLVEQQKTNLAGFYKQNLKPLLYAANLSNEDIFNFAFDSRLPLDKNNSQYLQLGYDTLGKGYFEIKTGNVAAANQNNLEKFIKALDLNAPQRVKVDSILQAYAEDIQSQVLVNDKNTVAINPNIWNFKKAILADIIAFAQNANGKEFSKICPVDAKLYDNKSFVAAINEAKKTKNNHYIFFTPDTIFSESYAFDNNQFKNDFKKMKDQMKSAKQDWEKMSVSLDLKQSIDKLKHYPSWAKSISVQFDNNTCRVNMPNMVQEIPMPDFDSIIAQVVKSTDVLKNITIIIPDDPELPEVSNPVNYSYKMIVPGHSGKEMKIRVDLDSILTHSKKFKNQFYSFGPNGQINIDSLVESIKSKLPDSLTMKEFQVEMKKFQKQMMELQKELQKNMKATPAPKKPVEI